ncbi:MAG TPA: SDR family oxidoreductase [Stellaceae bacterium]|nr:SDR family oxidoreductase [Stellaceae bacterium]
MTTLDGKTCVITGATSGIGLATAEALARKGARLVLVGRDRAKGEQAASRLKTLCPGCEVVVLYADLARLAGARQLAAAVLDAAPRIDVLINNAGAIFRRRAETGDGLEHTFALNHMAYFVVTQLLRDRLVASAPARIVNVASTAHRGAALDFDDLQMARHYDGWTAYRRSKLCNILFTRALARRLAGSGVTANALHPGFVASRFGDNNDGLLRLVLSLGKRFVAISAAAGAETPVHLAAAPEVADVSGLYFDKCRAATPSPAAQDDRAAERLWQESTRLAGWSQGNAPIRR